MRACPAHLIRRTQTTDWSTMAIPRTTNRWMVIGIVAMVANIALATAVIATHRFKDVPSSDIFHGDITWLADNDITRGCNPPANDHFCPDDNVTRGQMAAFMHRYARAFGTRSEERRVGKDSRSRRSQ